MKDYDLSEYMEGVYARLNDAGDIPVIGITTNYAGGDVTLGEQYYKQVAASGGVPVLLPPVGDARVLQSFINCIDGLLLTGGGDADPRWMGEEPSALLSEVNECRDLPELVLARLARDVNMPVLGICRGVQMMAVAYGGHVAQDISLDNNRKAEIRVRHSQDEPRDTPTHTVYIEPGSILSGLYPTERMSVNSFHHQTVDVPPPGFRISARASDGVAEAMESDEAKPLAGVQWHPEWLGEDGLPLFARLAGEAKTYKEVKRLHETIVTIDSHCDTPMFFPAGADITRRDERIKVDLSKMTTGRLDAATMVAYVPQPVGSQTWGDVAPIKCASPFDYVNIIFDKIEEMVSRSTIPVGIARSAKDIIANKRAGRRSVMLAIENALALGGDINNVEYFKKRGAVYFTLCHNGDNQICDSACKSTGCWGGLSPFGREVVKEMNRTGVVIDLSHAAERTFFDVLEMSELPVVCSHSNCKALCNHVRNLSDEQLRALSGRGGVCQLTLYAGFTTINPGEADIFAFVDHVVH
ncbi:MAG: membrane dipeptidase, partial [Prevotella sp.]|nr:membrane dipeptidase [Prevotella sp.]